MLKRIVLSMMALSLAAFVLIGCGGPPKEDMDKATMAMKKAVEAKADMYAKDMYEAGDKAMKEGAELVKKNEFDKAKAKYMEATKQFDAAAKAAPDAMNAMKAEVEKAIADFETAWTAGEKDMMKKMGMAKKDDKAKMDKMMTDAKAKLAEAKEKAAAGDYVAAKAAIEEAGKMHMEMMPAKK